MRRFLRLLAVGALGASALGTVPAAAAEQTWLVVDGSDPLLNENGDHLWESARIGVYTDADSAHWTLTSPTGEAVAGAELTGTELQAAQHGNHAVEIGSVTTGSDLESGTHTFTVTAATVGEEPTTRSVAIHVSNGPAWTALVPSASTIYPRDTHPGVPHTVAFRHRVDPTVLAWGSVMWDVVGPDGRVDGPWWVEADEPLLRWDGTVQPATGGRTLAPEGTYRIRLLGRDGGWFSYGPLSQPVTVSWDYRVPVTRRTSRPAVATRTATLTQRYARVRAVDGSLRYRAFNTDWRQRPLVRTAHRVSIPRDRAPGFPVFLVVRGRIALPIELDLEVVTPAGKVRNIDIFGAKDRRSLSYSIPRPMIRADGTVRFRLLWTSWGPPSRTGRTDTVGLEYTSYVWRGPA